MIATTPLRHGLMKRVEADSIATHPAKTAIEHGAAINKGKKLSVRVRQKSSTRAEYRAVILCIICSWHSLTRNDRKDSPIIKIKTKSPLKFP